MKKHIFVIMSLICIFVCGFSGYSSLPLDAGTGKSLDYIITIGDNASINCTTKVITAKGYGASPTKVKDLGRRKLMALRAAEMDAYRRLLEAVKGVQVTSQINVAEMMRKSQTVYTKVTGMIQGMQVVNIAYSSDGGCTVTMKVNVAKKGKFLLAALNKGEIEVTDNYPKFDWVKVLKDRDRAKAQLGQTKSELDKTKSELAESRSEHNKTKDELAESLSKIKNIENDLKNKEKPVDRIHEELKKNTKKIFNCLTADEDYTGLLVDARGIELKHTLYPAILNHKEAEMYGPRVNPGNQNQGIMIPYLHGNPEFVKRKKYKEVGDNPLVVKGINVKKKSDIVIGAEDAEKVECIARLLKQKKVAILI
jgi:hypothetical protein